MNNTTREGVEGPGTDYQDFRANTAELLTGSEVADIVKEAFYSIPIEHAANLVDSNVVLALAKFKGEAEFFVDVPGEADDAELKASIEKINKIIQENNPHIHFLFESEPILAASDGTRSQMVSVINLDGYERMTNLTKIEGVIKYNPNTGMEGRKKWEEEMGQTFPHGTPKWDVVVGLSKGYPDRAILDHMEAEESGDLDDLPYVNIPNTGVYDEARPNFMVSPEHANDPEIIENMSQASKILEEFYNSDWHKSVEDKLAFHRQPQYE